MSLKSENAMRMRQRKKISIVMCMLWCLCGVMMTGCSPTDPSLNKDADENNQSSHMMQPPVDDMMVTTGPDMSAPVPDLPVVLPPGEDITIASFNVERLFDERCDSSCGPGEFEEVTDALELNSRISRIQRAITKIDADVLVLQEIEKESLLDRLMETLGDEYPTQVYGESGFAGSMDIAVISRGSLVKTVRHRDTPIMTQSGASERFARELLELHLDIKGVRVIAFGAHFISKASNNSSARRWAEANATGLYASQEAMDNPEALVVVAGDLNDTLDSTPLEAISSKGLDAMAEGKDPNVYYTHVFSGMRQVIDHIFYVPAPNVVPHPDGFSVVRDDGRDGLGNSDHASPRQVFRVGD